LVAAAFASVKTLHAPATDSGASNNTSPHQNPTRVKFLTKRNKKEKRKTQTEQNRNNHHDNNKKKNQQQSGAKSTSTRIESNQSDLTSNRMAAIRNIPTILWRSSPFSVLDPIVESPNHRMRNNCLLL